MSLSDEVKNKSKEIYTDNYPMSIGELANIYKDGELDLHPEFQREFRWTTFQKTRLIESLLLGIPIPPIFVVQRDDAVWDVIDGLQRLSTIFEFMGILKDDNGNLLSPFKLNATRFLPGLEGIVFLASENQTPGTKLLPQNLAIALKRVKIGINIIQNSSDPNVKYELFQRLNTGGTSLSPQEVRNCLIIMEEPEKYPFIKELSHNKYFRDALQLSDRQIEEKYDMELVCRYLVGRYSNESDYTSLKDINDFISERVLKILREEDLTKEKSIFEELFQKLSNTGERIFAKYDRSKDGFKGMFLISAFEAIAIGLSNSINNYADPQRLLERIKEIWTQEEFINMGGSGTSAKSRMGKTIAYGKTFFQ